MYIYFFFNNNVIIHRYQSTSISLFSSAVSAPLSLLKPCFFVYTPKSNNLKAANGLSNNFYKTYQRINNFLKFSCIMYHKRFKIYTRICACSGVSTSFFWQILNGLVKVTTPFCNEVGIPSFLNCGSILCWNCGKDPSGNSIVWAVTNPERANSISSYSSAHSITYTHKCFFFY